MMSTASASLKSSAVAEMVLLSEDVVSTMESTSCSDLAHVVSLTSGWLGVDWLLNCAK